MRASDALKAAIPGGRDTWDSAGMMKVDRFYVESLIAEIDDLQRNLSGARVERDRWRQRCLKAEGVPYWEQVDLEPLEEIEFDDVIAITPEQLVRIVREAGKP